MTWRRERDGADGTSETIQGLQAREGRQVRAGEGSLRRVEVLVTGCPSGSPSSRNLDQRPRNDVPTNSARVNQ